jgi:hypothetical protein
VEVWRQVDMEEGRSGEVEGTDGRAWCEAGVTLSGTSG